MAFTVSCPAQTPGRAFKKFPGGIFMAEEITPIGKYMYAELWPRIEGRRTDRWAINSTKGGGQFRLGFVSWYFGWRQYTFNPDTDTTFSSGCLGDMAEFLKSVNENQRKNRKKA